jgi:hypothetical protein
MASIIPKGHDPKQESVSRPGHAHARKAKDVDGFMLLERIETSIAVAAQRPKRVSESIGSS